MNMIYPAVSSIKSRIYEITRDHISKHGTDPSETVYFSEKQMANAEWKEEREFVLHGFSYDIIKVDLKNGQKYYQCYVDKKDIVLNSILKLSGFFVTKKVCAWRHFTLPAQHTKLIKASGFFIFSGTGQPELFSFYRNPESDYFKRLKNTCDLSVIIPPPEERYIA
ncbi:hypothetical protein CHA01nite_18170 [Chryseobacterium hagamense]|uniref:Uncharacterized protein n=2 Tax=Chryseobacterium hagamense TaxID=395935 RepID=A0A511YLJ9_9FLAO|nr:hypothetical protein CHA01nite_18170 [Chryseobacterium hagamense]